MFGTTKKTIEKLDNYPEDESQLKITESYKTAVISTTHVTQHDSECLPNICFDPQRELGKRYGVRM
ncbi:hypothetical protein OH773_22265 (plasmid) [Buttiauxella sp. WJP83]|uniref:hypothetical protein n=1 Tax=Buttiauxella sp. WJP83 TaxID=2986951 RepID=UPI0022DE1E2B|nr:hypothetical protein [Buttiauxella sp. WJP83]WBM72970.1 hypothetical protein OH773_22265 [Buttiauxella sp. WJP83]